MGNERTSRVGHKFAKSAMQNKKLGYYETEASFLKSRHNCIHWKDIKLCILRTNLNREN